MYRNVHTFPYLIFIITSIFSMAAIAITPSDFAKNPEIYDVKISPGGDYIAVAGLFEGERQLAFLDAKTMQKVGDLNFTRPHQVGEFFWVNNERIVTKVMNKDASQEEPMFFGELYAVNFDGKKGDLLYGYRVAGGKGSLKLTTKTRTRGWADILHILPDDEKHILISSLPYSKDGSKPARVQRLNVYTGKLRSIETRAPVPGATFITDNSGEVRFVHGVNEQNEPEFYQRDLAENEWHIMEEFSGDATFWPLAFSASNKSFYYAKQGTRSTQGLYRLKLSDFNSKHMFTDKDVDITDVLFSQEQGFVYALRVDVTYPEYIMLDKKSQEATIFRSLLDYFQGLKISITSRTEDGNSWILQVSSDTSAGDYYLFDQKNKKLSKLFSSFSSLPAKDMAVMQPVAFYASDKQLVRGYLTLPKNIEKPVPLVTLVHGGPHGIRDYWGYDAEVQMLASQGYGVLQVNFRGSGGYGLAFKEAGYKQWGDRIQKDIIEGTQWALTQPEIDPEKVCIMGASFGGYSAAQSSILAPELFDCAVAVVGVFDLNMMFDEGDITDMYAGKKYLEMVLGTDKTVRDSYSPVNNVEKLQAPVLIIHGEEDRRVPIEQARAFRAALEAADKKYEWLVKSNETHGFYSEENRGQYYEKVASFLRQHLK